MTFHEMQNLGVVLLLLGSAGTAAAQGSGYGRGLPTPVSGIEGRVVDSTGNPVADVFVTALYPQSAGPRPFMFVDARLSAVTDAKGNYRLTVGAGSYLVVALPHNVIYGPGNRVNTRGSGKTFFPGAALPADATPVIVRGPAPARADITLVPATLALVSGVVIGADGKPVLGGILGVTHGDSLFGLDSRGVRIGTDGRFGVPALPPGTYFLQYHGSAWPPPVNVIPDVSGAKVVVNGSDITGVRVAPIHMVTTTGRLIVNPIDARDLPSSSITVGSQLVDFDGNPGPTRPGTPGDDRTFSFKSWPGLARVRVEIRTPGWRVTSIRYRGVDITNTPIDFVEGRDMADMEIVLERYGGPAR